MANNKVLIIEARSSQDIYNDISEGKTLQKILKLEGITAIYKEAVTKQYFKKAIKKAESENIKYVHFSGHGSEEGFWINDNEFIDWREFDELCWPLLKGKCLCFSSCSIGKGVHKIFELHKTFSNVIIAPSRDITWGEGLVAFTALYHKAMNNLTYTKDDVKVMNSIVGRGTFMYIPSGNETTYVLS